jgi:hypothetical protein
MNKDNLTPFEQELLDSMNKKALLIIKAEQLLKEAKIPFNTQVLFELEEDELEEMCQNWAPENQTRLRAQFKETNGDEEHTK